MICRTDDELVDVLTWSSGYDSTLGVGICPRMQRSQFEKVGPGSAALSQGCRTDVDPGGGDMGLGVPRGPAGGPNLQGYTEWAIRTSVFLTPVPGHQSARATP